MQTANFWALRYVKEVIQTVKTFLVTVFAQYSHLVLYVKLLLEIFDNPCRSVSEGLSLTAINMVSIVWSP